MAEIWRPVPGYGGHYEASNLGRVRSVDRVVVKRHRSGKTIQQRYAGRLLTPCPSDELGHMVVHLGVDGRRLNVAVHRLVLLAFAGEPQPGAGGLPSQRCGLGQPARQSALGHPCVQQRRPSAARHLRPRRRPRDGRAHRGRREGDARVRPGCGGGRKAVRYLEVAGVANPDQEGMEACLKPSPPSSAWIAPTCA